MGVTGLEFWATLLGILIILAAASSVNSVIDQHKVLYDNAFPVIWLLTGILLTLSNVKRDSPNDYHSCHLHNSGSFFMIIVHCLKWKKVVAYFWTEKLI